MLLELCVLHGADSLGPLGTTWAIIGLRKASKSLSRAIQARETGMAFYTSLAEFLIQLTFSVMLLFYPAEKFKTHVALLGLELFAVSIRLTWRSSPGLDVEAQPISARSGGFKKPPVPAAIPPRREARQAGTVRTNPYISPPMQIPASRPRPAAGRGRASPKRAETPAPSSPAGAAFQIGRAHV